METGQERSVSGSVVERLKLREPETWSKMVQLFYPLVLRWCRLAGLQEHAAADVCQEVFRALANNMERFEYDEGRNSFRAWLRGITNRQLMAYWRRRSVPGEGGSTAQQRMAEVPAPLDEPSADEVRSEKQELLRRALEQLRKEVEPKTFEAFWRVVAEEKSPAEVAAAMGLSVNSVYLAKARLLRKLREEFGELLMEPRGQ